MFNVDHSDNLSPTPKQGNSGVVVRGMSRSGSLSLHAILKESPSEDDSDYSEGENSDFPL
jgi:hypothetical protein